jgi:hypothetical protein
MATVLLGGVVVWLGQGPPTPPTASAAPVPPQAGSRPPVILGVSSCAAAACHNANGPRESRGSEYGTWAAVDPHARAYEVLLGERSQQIQKLRQEETPAHEDVTCLKCHSTYRDLPARGDAMLASGVGCESCHGDAEIWKDAHYRQPFNRATPGFKDLRNDLVVRAESCVGCHLGNAEKDVNHDLIAAGHPRLRFEFGAYLANYPKHWNEADDLKRFPDLQGRAWVLGQLVSAQASLELLREQATNLAKRWPEFSQYDCYACHHDLIDPSWRRQRGFSGRKPGALPLNDWYLVVPVMLAPDQTGKDLATGLQTLTSRLALFPPQNDKPALAGLDQFTEVLKPWRDSLPAAAPMDRAAVTALLRVLSADPEGRALEHPDHAIQFYLGVAALQDALPDRGRQTFPGLEKSIDDLADVLERAFQGEDKAGSPIRYDSPRNLKRDDLGKCVREIQSQLAGKQP